MSLKKSVKICRDNPNGCQAGLYCKNTEEKIFLQGKEPQCTCIMCKPPEQWKSCEQQSLK